MDDYESVLLVKNNVNIYKIPSISGNLKYRAADWNLEKPEWTGRLKLINVGTDCFIKFEDPQGKLFAKCPIDNYPSKSIEGVSDSSRYFVVKLLSDDGRSAFVGLGFVDRADSFDLNVALQDHFRWLHQSSNIDKKDNKIPDLNVDLRLKEGETIKINFTQQKTKESPKIKIKAACQVKIPTQESTFPIESNIFPAPQIIHTNSSKWETF